MEGFVTGNEKVYPIIRNAMVTYGINCRETLTARTLIWKRLVEVIWPNDFDAVVMLKPKSKASEVGHSTTSASAPPPPEYPEGEPEGLHTDLDMTPDVRLSPTAQTTEETFSQIEDTNLIQKMVAQVSNMIKMQNSSFAKEIPDIKARIY